MGSLDYVSGSARSGYEMIKKNAQPLFIDLLKVSALSTIISIGGLVIAGVLLYILIGEQIMMMLTMMSGRMMYGPSMVPDFTSFIIPIVLAIIVFVIFSLISGAASSVEYNVVQNRSTGKPTAVLEQFFKNLVPVVLFNIVIWIVLFLLMLPMILAAALGDGGGAIFCCLALISSLAFILFAFFMQFGLTELVLTRKGVIDALKTSARLVRANLLAVFLLDIVVLILAIVSGVAEYIFEQIIGIIPAMFEFGGFEALVIGYLIYLGIYMVGSVVVQAITATVILPIWYHFWKGLKR